MVACGLTLRGKSALFQKNLEIILVAASVLGRMAPINYVDVVYTHQLVWLGPRSWQADLFCRVVRQKQLVRELASGDPFRVMPNRKKGELTMSKKFTGILTGKSNENRGSSRYSLEMSGTLTVDGQAIEVNLFGDYALTGGVAKGKFVITTGNSEDDLEEGMDWMEAEFEQLSFASAVFYSSGQGGLLKGYKRGGFELQIDLRKYGNMSDGWTITFG